jgi:hypothetical protein
MTEKEYLNTQIVPEYIKVLKALFEKNPSLWNLYQEQLQSTTKNNYEDDPIFSFLMK